jgi:hypothetical protein
VQDGVTIELSWKSGDIDLDILQRRNSHGLMDAERGRDASQRGQSVADAIGSTHDAAVKQNCEQKSGIEH